MAQACSFQNPFTCCQLSDLRFWGREFNYDESIACIRRGGIILRKGKSAPRDPNPIASTSKQPEEQELLDDDQDEEVDEEVVPDESFDADWSGDIMCVADPFIVSKARKSLPFTAVIFTQWPPLSELCGSDQEVDLYPVHPRV